MRIAQFVKDTITGRRFRMTTTRNGVPKDMHNSAFNEAARELEDLVKSRRSQVGTMADAKDYMESDIDDFGRTPQGVRRRDMRESSRDWRGIQALDDDELFALGDELAEESRAMLVSGRPAKIRFPGAKGDSTIEPFDRERYVADADDDLDSDFPEGRSAVRQRYQRLRGTLGGDSMSWRSQASRRGVGEDSYANSKSLGGRTIGPLALLKSFGAIKSKLSRAMMDECLDPNILLNYDAAGTEPRLGVDLSAAMRALAQVPPAVRQAYNIPTIAENRFEEMGAIRRGLA